MWRIIVAALFMLTVLTKYICPKRSESSGCLVTADQRGSSDPKPFSAVQQISQINLVTQFKDLKAGQMSVSWWKLDDTVGFQLVWGGLYAGLKNIHLESHHTSYVIAPNVSFHFYTFKQKQSQSAISELADSVTFDDGQADWLSPFLIQWVLISPNWLEESFLE